jgi:1-acyl-sn-glycerol-3-phosphate acyltransferase
LSGVGSPTLRLARIAVYLVWTLLVMPVQGTSLLLRAPWSRRLPRVYHRCCCRILGLKVRVLGAPIGWRPALFVANHISYIDIAVLGSVVEGSFVAKSEVASWPLFGWLAKLQRSVFVDRRVGSTARQRDAIGARLASGDGLILFAEGTSSDGNRVLPLKSALLSAAASADGIAVPVQPVSLAYTRLDGIPIGRHYRPFVAWYGAMALLPHLWRMLGLGTVEAVVEFHPPTALADCGSRKRLAEYCYGRIAGGVAAALAGRPQPMPEPPAGPAAALPQPATG